MSPVVDRFTLTALLKNVGQIRSVVAVRISPVKAIAETALLAPHQTANPPTIKAPNGPVPIDEARTPNTRPRISTGVDVITMMLCIVAKPAIENPPIRRIGRANKNDGDNEKASIAPRDAKEPYA